MLSRIKALSVLNALASFPGVAGKMHIEFQNDLLRDHLIQFPHFFEQGVSEKIYQVLPR